MSQVSEKCMRILKELSLTMANRMTIDELIHSVGPAKSKQSMQNSIRILERDGYVLRSYSNLGRVKLVVILTTKGRALV